MFALRHVVFALLVVGVAAGQKAQAAPIIGTLGAIPIDLVMDGTDLASSTLVTGSDLLSSGTTGDLAAIPGGTSFGPLTLDISDLVGSFTFSHATFGAFAPASAIISTQTADLLVLALFGTFAPGVGLPGFDPTSARMDVTVSLSGAEGGALEGTLLLTTTPATVPEPASAAMVVLGGLALARRRRRMN